MSDDDPTTEPSFDDPSFDELRALLAQARVKEPVPEHVAARLDATLQSLQAERVEAAGRVDDAPLAPVVPLRRRAGRILVAAAAVVVIGAGGVAIAQRASNSANGGSADSVAADKASSGGSAEDGSIVPAVPGRTGTKSAAGAAKALPQLTTSSFASDATRIMRDTYLTSLDARSPATTDSSGQVPSDAPAPVNGYAALEAPPVTTTPDLSDALIDGVQATTCPGPAAPDAVIEPATLDGALVALVFRPPTADAQRVEAWSCDGASLLASADIGH